MRNKNSIIAQKLVIRNRNWDGEVGNRNGDGENRNGEEMEKI
jgi:hypothetical protein